MPGKERAGLARSAPARARAARAALGSPARLRRWPTCRRAPVRRTWSRSFSRMGLSPLANW